MPEDVSFRPNLELLQNDEILRLVGVFAGLGFDKFRLTGGEPTVRANIVGLVHQITQTPGVRCLTMTSNGILFAKLAQPLKEAGLHRVNFSLDTLNPEHFKRLTRRGSLDEVLAGIYAAERAGLLPIKINVVVVRGYSDEDVTPLARLTLEHAWQVRYIEMMPFGGATAFQLAQMVTADEVRAKIERDIGPLHQVNGGKLDGEARLYHLPGARGDLGFISTVSQPFCADCSRARLTADGRLRLCLLCEDEVDLLTPMRAGATDAHLRQLILDGIWNKPWGNRLPQGEVALNRAMSEIGG
jgi:cyclic pyranopterin phosphate synthase